MLNLKFVQSGSGFFYDLRFFQFEIDYSSNLNELFFNTPLQFLMGPYEKMQWKTTYLFLECCECKKIQTFISILMVAKFDFRRNSK